MVFTRSVRAHASFVNVPRAARSSTVVRRASSAVAPNATSTTPSWDR
jgi:hypothetical protein